ncbi:hypothetical protein Lal_00043124 [Lupinus albus]|nr:hypothetical protein Lal_00043124 [Lupinus albus]
MFQCMNSGSIVNNNASNVDMNDLLWAINQNLKDVDGKKGVDETEHDTIMALNGAEALNGEGANIGVEGKGMIEANIGVVENEDLAFDFAMMEGMHRLHLGMIISQMSLRMRLVVSLVFMGCVYALIRNQS